MKTTRPGHAVAIAGFATAPTLIDDSSPVATDSRALLLSSGHDALLKWCGGYEAFSDA
jgi:hypothetical protein